MALSKRSALAFGFSAIMVAGIAFLAFCAIAGIGYRDGHWGAQTVGVPPPKQLNEVSIAQLRVMLKGFPGDWRQDSDRSQKRPVPPSEVPIADGARRVALIPPADFHLGDTSVRDAIAARRSLRSFSNESLTLEELSFLLWATQGITSTECDSSGDVIQQFRAAPSAGARYPLETYIAVTRVNGIGPGLYRYRPPQHELVLLREDPALAANLQTACYDQSFVGAAAAVFIWTTIPYRTEWKYTYISHRMIAMEAGHVCENLYLAAGSFGAGVCGLMAYHQPAVDQLLGVDGEGEFALYLACVGKPEKTK